MLANVLIEFYRLLYADLPLAAIVCVVVHNVVPVDGPFWGPVL